jgi:hypothetical protein
VAYYNHRHRRDIRNQYSPIGLADPRQEPLLINKLFRGFLRFYFVATIFVRLNVRSKRITFSEGFFLQCCGAETICFCSGSDFQKVSAPAPAPAPAPASEPALAPEPALTIALKLPVITDFI